MALLRNRDQTGLHMGSICWPMRSSSRVLMGFVGVSTCPSPLTLGPMTLVHHLPAAPRCPSVFHYSINSENSPVDLSQRMSELLSCMFGTATGSSGLCTAVRAPRVMVELVVEVPGGVAVWALWCWYIRKRTTAIERGLDRRSSKLVFTYIVYHT